MYFTAFVQEKVMNKNCLTVASHKAPAHRIVKLKYRAANILIRIVFYLVEASNDTWTVDWLFKSQFGERTGSCRGG